jgi:hypothetical protein
MLSVCSTENIAGSLPLLSPAALSTAKVASPLFHYWLQLPEHRNMVVTILDRCACSIHICVIVIVVQRFLNDYLCASKQTDWFDSLRRVRRTSWRMQPSSISVAMPNTRSWSCLHLKMTYYMPITR